MIAFWPIISERLLADNIRKLLHCLTSFPIDIFDLRGASQQYTFIEPRHIISNKYSLISAMHRSRSSFWKRLVMPASAMRSSEKSSQSARKRRHISRYFGTDSARSRSGHHAAGPKPLLVVIAQRLVGLQSPDQKRAPAGQVDLAIVRREVVPGPVDGLVAARLDHAPGRLHRLKLLDAVKVVLPAVLLARADRPCRTGNEALERERPVT